jgi:hypothetical protein
MPDEQPQPQPQGPSIIVAQSDIRYLTERLNEFMAEVRAWMRETNERQLATGLNIVALQEQTKAMAARIDDLEDELNEQVGALQRKSERWDLINSIAAALLGVFAYLNNRP